MYSGKFHVAEITEYLPTVPDLPGPPRKLVPVPDWLSPRLPAASARCLGSCTPWAKLCMAAASLHLFLPVRLPLTRTHSAEWRALNPPPSPAAMFCFPVQRRRWGACTSEQRSVTVLVMLAEEGCLSMTESSIYWSLDSRGESARCQSEGTSMGVPCDWGEWEAVIRI